MRLFSWIKRIFQRKGKPGDDPRLQELQKDVDKAVQIYHEKVEPRISITKISKVQARMRNIERRKSSMRRHRGKFKPRSALEKKLWKPDAKPEEEEISS